MKYCPDCKETKEESEFYASKQTLDKLFGFCKCCCRSRQIAYAKLNKIKKKKYRESTRIERAIHIKRWRAKNKEKILDYKRKYEKTRKSKDVGYRMLCNIRNRIGLAIKSNSKTSPTKKLLGCTISQLKNHLEARFTENMDWNNYGVKGWHIDHIRPCSSFDLSSPEEQKKCFHYTNLQPLWHTDNLLKSDNF